jgi:multidrug efflux pump subunit AcrA (membrane-fusion protein)
MKPCSPVLLAFLLLAAAARAAGADASPAARVARLVILDEAGEKNLRLETVEAEARDFAETLFVLGRIEVLPGRRAVVSSRVPGRVVRVDALPDHPVQAGDPVVVLESRQPGDPPPEITLTAPLSGLVTEFTAAPGEPVHPDKALLAIVDLRTVYGLAQVPEHLVHQLARGQAATIRVPGWPDEVWDATLEHLGAEADRSSGTLEAAFYVRNPGLRLRPGMRAEFSIALTNRAGVLAVPRAAVQGEGAERFVFIRDYELKHAFVKVPVVTGARNDQFVEITQGLLPGDEVVTRGAYSLAFAGKGSVSLKEALDAAHGHPHNEDGSELTAEPQAAAGGNSGPGAAEPRSMTPLAWFFAGTTALLALALAGSPAFRRKEPPPAP